MDAEESQHDNSEEIQRLARELNESEADLNAECCPEGENVIVERDNKTALLRRNRINENDQSVYSASIYSENPAEGELPGRINSLTSNEYLVESE